MGYRVEYDGGIARKKQVHRRSVRWQWIASGVAVLVLISLSLLPAGRKALRDLVLPGDEEVTAQALAGMVDDLKEGKQLGEAVEAFCREIIADGY